MADWDVFVSYTHADQLAASRIQSFVEDYPLPGGRRRLRVFRDKTDLRAGELGRVIPREIGRARALMLCCSPAAARSGWVGREVAAFQAAHGESAPLVPLLLAGEPEAVVPEALRGREALILDLRAGWRFGRPRATTRVELLRAVAAAADLPLRELIPWDAARRRRRLAIASGIGAVAIAAIVATTTLAWLTRRDADAAALHRDAETAVLRIEAGEVAEGLAALGHALARDDRGLLADGLDVFRHWLAALPPAAEDARRHPGLLRIGGRIHLRDQDGRLAAIELAEPFAATAPWPGRIVAVGPAGIDLVAASGAVDAHVTLPAGTRIVGQYLAQDGSALAVLARMTLIENDGDEPNLPIPCTALLLRGGAVAADRSTSGPVAVKVATTEGVFERTMQVLPGGELFGHDCVADAFASEAPTEPPPALGLALAVPRVPEGNDVIVPESGTWDDAMRAAWPPAPPLPVVTLPALRAEASLWQAAGAAPPHFPVRLGLATTMDEAATAALGFDAVDEGGSMFGEVVELAGFAQAGNRTFWSLYVCGNSFICVARCSGPDGGPVTKCARNAGMSALAARQVYAPDARRFAHLSQHMGEPPVAVFDVASYSLRGPDHQPPAPVAGAAFTADSRRLVVLTDADQLVVYLLADDGTPREERRFGLGRAGAEPNCTGADRIVALDAATVAVLTHECTLQRVDVTRGTSLWRTRPDIATGAGAGAQLAATAGEGPLAVLAGGRLRLFHPRTGAALAQPLDPADLPGLADGDAGRARLPVSERPPAPSIYVGELRFVRAAPPDVAAAQAALARLDRHTLISRADGHTPLAHLPDD